MSAQHRYAQYTHLPRYLLTYILAEVVALLSFAYNSTSRIHTTPASQALSPDDEKSRKQRFRLVRLTWGVGPKGFLSRAEVNDGVAATWALEVEKALSLTHVVFCVWKPGVSEFDVIW